MSPYRVAVIDTTMSKSVMCSMLSTDKKTGEHNIYILLKTASGLDESDNVTPYMRRIAHKMSGKLNSRIMGKYIAYKDNMVRRYMIDRYVDTLGPDPQVTTLDIIEYTLSDCLKRAMEDYCRIHGLNIIQEL